jgi:hypothetical protein
VTETRSFPGLSLEVRNGSAPGPLPRVDVVLSGPAAALHAIEAAQVRPYLDLAQAPPAGGPAPVAVELNGQPGGVMVKETHPDTVVLRGPRRPPRAK